MRDASMLYIARWALQKRASQKYMVAGGNPLEFRCEKCRLILNEQLTPRLFRPPYGRISLRQLVRLSRQYEIVMWDVMGMDYKPELDANQVVANITDHVRPGSIALLHDSKLASGRVVDALPKILSHFQEQGYEFRALE